MVADSTEKVTNRILVDTPYTDWELGREYPGMAGMRFRRDGEGEGTFACAACGKTEMKHPNGVQSHWNLHCPENPKRAEHDKAREDSLHDPKVGPTVRSRRGLKRQGVDRAPTVLEEIRDRPGGMMGGPAAYFIRPDGASIREALVIYPNGAPVIRNGRDRANSRYAQDRQKNKGFEYIGPTLTVEGIRRLIEVIKGNQYDYLLDLKEQIQECEYTIANSDRPEVRDNARKRRGQLERLVEIARREVEPEKIAAEMDDILKAMKLAALSPSQREAITIMMGGEVDARLQTLIGRMEKKVSQSDLGDTVSVTNAGANEDF